jgi:hypothetical protein
MPKASVRTVPNPVGNKVGKRIPTVSNIPPKTHPLRSSSFLWTPTPFMDPVLHNNHLHKEFSSCPNLQSHLPMRALSNSMGFLIPNPPLGTGQHTVFQFTRCNMGSLPGPSQRKSLWRSSNLLAMSTSKGKRDKKYEGMLDSVLLMSKAPPLDK